MKVASIITAAVLTAAAAGFSQQVLPASIAIRNVTVIDGTGATPRPNRTVIVADGRIADERSSGQAADAGGRSIDGTGKYLIPGLWEMHAHLSAASDLALPLLIANGVTGVRDAGGDLVIIDALRARIAAGTLVGPRVFRAGPFVDGPKPVPYRLVVDTEDEARRAVVFLKERGVDFIKVHTAVPPAPYFALLAEARQQRLQVIGHIPLAVEPAAAIEAGHGSVEHVVSLFEGPVSRKVRAGMAEAQAIAEFSDADAAALASAMVRHGTWFDPTMIAYWSRSFTLNHPSLDDPRYPYVSNSLREYWKVFPPIDDTPDRRARLAKGWERFVEIARVMRRAHVRFLVGTDLGGVNIYPGFSVHDELQRLVDLGFTPLEVLSIATRNSAESLGRLDQLGTIARGKRADLVLLDANPLDDIAHTRRIAAVIADGRVYLKPEIDAILADVTRRAPSR